MYTTSIRQLSENQFRIRIRDGSGWVIFEKIRSTLEKAREEQIEFMFKGPNISRPKKENNSWKAE